ncbi:hypothetical protein [Pseudomonas sp. FP2309]|uniref:hypothetical protein n=1 Tax=Pseudomonas sp. FP2309 TaxID=2954091 RepID=UPI0027347262|nr:hypothetical protein [Pseudomonas sp. FP2309]WLH66265.1 hypothetical protein PSH59_13995 [Pseudomonas sp. FP2309]
MTDCTATFTAAQQQAADASKTLKHRQFLEALSTNGPGGEPPSASREGYIGVLLTTRNANPS